MAPSGASSIPIPQTTATLRATFSRNGAWRPRDGVQRGSVMDMPLYPGDPLTPGVGATKDAKRLDLKDVKTITKIPVLPISYADAQPLLAALKGDVVPEAWRGSLPQTYHVGPGPAKVHLKVQSNWDIKPLYDVIVKIPGSTNPDEWVVRGNHHDAWVNGAEDPDLRHGRPDGRSPRASRPCSSRAGNPSAPSSIASGMAKNPACSVRPNGARRTPMNFASTPWPTSTATATAAAISRMGGSHSLEKFINGVARDIQDPEKKIPVWKRDQLKAIADAKTPEDRKEARDRADLRIDALGSGSDWTVFPRSSRHRVVGSRLMATKTAAESTTPSTTISTGTPISPTPTSATDARSRRPRGPRSCDWPTPTCCPTISPAWPIPSIATSTNCKNSCRPNRTKSVERNKELEEGVFTAIADPRKTSVPPPAEEVPPHLNFAPLQNASEALTHSAERYQKALEKVSSNGELRVSPAELQALNQKLMQSERKLTSTDGLPRRPWFEHLIYAPGAYTGYGVKTIPGVREAIEQKKWKEADEQIARAATALQDEAALIDSAAQDLEKGK